MKLRQSADPTRRTTRIMRLSASRMSCYEPFTMLILVTFLLGIGNFAVHRAVLDSGHPLLGQVPWFFHLLGGRFSLMVEFTMLLGAMLMVAGGSSGWAWFYGGYSLVNATSAWLILTGRV